jgi:hypothetical protein
MIAKRIAADPPSVEARSGSAAAAGPEARRPWLVPAALVVLSLVPVAAGTARLVGLASGAAVTPENARFFASPLPAVLHILGASIWCLVGAFQFHPGLRRVVRAGTGAPVACWCRSGCSLRFPVCG